MVGTLWRGISRIVRSVYDRAIVKKRQEISFWVLYSFLATFSISRFIVYYFPDVTVSVNGVHIHHFAFGFVILAITGLVALNNWHHRYPRLVAILYGLGLGMAVDEFGMWIRLQDDYWVRRSYDAVLIVGAILTTIVYFGRFWGILFRQIGKYIQRRLMMD